MPREGNTRTKLIHAAYKVLAQQGYEATSIKDIAQEAGVSPGLVHYHFANKEELLAAVVKEAGDESCKQMELLRASAEAEQLAHAALAEPMNRVKTDPDWYRLRYEFYGLGLRNPAIKSSVRELLTTDREGIAETIEKVAGTPFAEKTNISAVVLACLDGFALQTLIDPDFDQEGAYEALKQMAITFIRSQGQSS